MATKRDLDSVRDEDASATKRQKLSATHPLYEHLHVLVTNSDAQQNAEVVQHAKSLQALLFGSGPPQDTRQAPDHHLKETSSTVPIHSNANSTQSHTTSSLPKLPSIADAAIEVAVFTHSSVASDSTGSNSRSQPGTHTYERLEFLGDAYIEIVSTRLIFANFPGLPVGKMAQLRESMVKNETLCKFAKDYGFQNRLRITEQERHATPSTWQKILADVFEAYVAAIILSDPKTGWQTAERWLAKLWAPKLAVNAECNIGYNANAKADIWRLVSGPHIKGVKVEYLEEKPPVVDKKAGKYHFTIGCYLTGWGHDRRRIGVGSADNKSRAGAMAASNALAESHGLLAESNEKKREQQSIAAEHKRCLAVTEHR